MIPYQDVYPLKITMPQTTEKLLDRIEEDEDVQNVYHNMAAE